MVLEAKMRGLLKAISHALSGNLLAALFAFASTALYSRYLEGSDFGVLVLLQSYILVFAALANPQSWQGLIKFGAKYKDSDLDSFHSVVSICAIQDFIYALLGAILAVILAPFYVVFFELPGYLTRYLQLFSVVVFFSQIGLGIGVLRLAGKFSYVALHAVFAAALNLVVALAASYFSLSLAEIITFMTLSMSIGALSLIALGLFSLKRQFISFDSIPLFKGTFDWRNVVKFNSYTHFTNMADIPVRLLDTILVGALLSVESAGVYKIIRQLGTIIDKFTGPVGQVLFPEFSMLLANNQLRKATALSSKVTLVVMAVSVPFSLLLAFTSSYWLPLVFGDYMSAYVWQLGVFFVLQAVTVSFMSIHPLFVALGFVKQQLWLTISLNVTFIVCTYYFSQYWALFGIILALAVQYFGTISVKLFMIKRTLNLTNIKN
ncbi:lipopolysaccharide biosynthesis protein [Colwellia sp. TT2012]|uniref:lipopolysaccharide biosynthesis protein n=1 Tax=Colwellia sp. TT2012 TaxID=1720342 RepID=UPI0007091C85|nr:oligosaccharide flippase family protein [Colwellia sp. TT2012]